MGTPREPLFERLPEIYKIRDGELTPPDQLKSFMGVLDEVLAAIRGNIETLYHDQFIETCADWVIPYIADLVGTSHLAGDPWTLRADVARTIHHRRRKGTLGAIESIAFSLSGWAAHAVEMRERLVWHQHLNHMRPDEGGMSPLTLLTNISTPVRGGVANLRDPAALSLLNGAFDPFAHIVDVKPPPCGSGHNLPNLAIFLWRLQDYTVNAMQPVMPAPPDDIIDLTAIAGPGEAAFSTRFNLHPLGQPMVLFNTHRFRADDDPPDLSLLDAVPGPMPMARLTQETPTGRPEHYVQVQLYNALPPPVSEDVGLTLHLPQAAFAGVTWSFRGANLIAWEAGLNPPLREHEIAIDPIRGRVVFGVANLVNEAQVLRDQLLVSATYGFSGDDVKSTGAHPLPRAPRPARWLDLSPNVITVNLHTNPGFSIEDALANTAAFTLPTIIEIEDSLTHVIDPANVVGIGPDDEFRLGQSLWIRATSNQRPVIRLARPLGFRPNDVLAPDAPALMSTLTVKLEGLYITRDDGFDVNAALINRAALHQLIVEGCTLDPGGHLDVCDVRQSVHRSMHLTNDYGFSLPAEETAFDQTPEIVVTRSITGPLAIDRDYTLNLTDTIVDAGSGVDDLTPSFAVGAASANPAVQWGPDLIVDGLTCFGRMRVESATGEGGIWIHQLEVHDNQKGCIKFSYFSGDNDRLPQHEACVFGTEASLAFVSEFFGQSGYAQLRRRSDRRILEHGPKHDAMGAFGYLLNTHKWKNINIRFREYMPVGIRPVLIPVT